MFSSNHRALFGGGLLVVIGLGALLANFGLMPAGVWDLWPLGVVGAGIWVAGRSVRRRGGRGLAGGFLLLALGLYWLLENFGRVDDRALLPGILIAVGVGVLLEAALRSRADRR